MLHRIRTKSLLIGLVAAASLFGFTACEAPDEAEAPTQESAHTAGAEAPSAGDDMAAEQAPAAGDQAPTAGDQMAAGGPQGEAPAQMEAPEGMQGQQRPQGQPQAQGQPMQQQRPPAPPPMEGEVSEEDLDQFAAAVETTSELQQEANLQQRMMEAESQAEQQEIQQEFVTELESEIEESGMSFQEYLAMAQRIEQDPELQQRFAERMQ